MTDRASGRSDELDKLRIMLFPNLAPEEGWRRIDSAFDAAADRCRLERIETLANAGRLDEELRRTLRRFDGNGR